MTSGKRTREEREAFARKNYSKVDNKQKRTTRLIIGGTALFIIALVVAVVAFVQVQRNTVNAESGLTPTAGYNTSAQVEITNDSIIVGKQDAPHTVTIYEDPICPYCGQFEQSSQEQVKDIVESGDAKVEFISVAFLDGASSDGNYSTRAASLLAAVAVQNPELWLDVHSAVYANQPEEGSTLNNADLLAVVESAGVELTPQIRASVDPISYDQWVADNTESASQDGVQGTPTIQIDGTNVTVRNGDELVAALDQVKE